MKKLFGMRWVMLFDEVAWLFNLRGSKCELVQVLLRKVHMLRDFFLVLLPLYALMICGPWVGIWILIFCDYRKARALRYDYADSVNNYTDFPSSHLLREFHHNLRRKRPLILSQFLCVLLLIYQPSQQQQISFLLIVQFSCVETNYKCCTLHFMTRATKFLGRGFTN